MFEVCYNVVKPVIEYLNPEAAESGKGMSWSTLVNQGEPQRPQIFISHSWQQRFSDFVESFGHLQLDRGLAATDAVWICTFANNQFDLDLGKELKDSPFYSALEHATEIALFVDHAAFALSRSWCCFELAVATDTVRNRMRWRVRGELARKDDVDLFDVAWAKVDKQVRLKQITMDAGTSEGDRQLLLCTPSGMVGTQRVTSGPVLKALQTLDSAKAEAFKA